MKFGHLLKSFEDEAAMPEAVCLNYKKLKKLIKAHTKQKECPAGGSAAGGPSSDEEELAPAGGPEAQPAAEAAAGGAAPEQGGAGGSGAAGAAGAGAQVAEEDVEFINTLNEDLSRINAYFMEREEDAVIRLRTLEDRLAAASAGAGTSSSGGGASSRGGGGRGGGGAGLPAAELEELRSQMVDFHGELVLLLHWSLVNYAAVAKILKKHDKLTGSRLRAPVLASVLHQPFLSTESISQLVKAAEQHVQELTQLCRGGAGPSGAGAPGAAAAAGAAAGAGAALGGAAAGDGAEAAAPLPCEPEEALGEAHVAMFKRTRAALHMLNDMQTTAHTPSTLLPATAASDAEAGGDADGGKRQRMAGESQAEQQAQQASVEVEAH